MKKFFYLLLPALLFAGIQPVNAQGKYAGTHKNLLGKIYGHDKIPPGLKGYQQVQGDLISPVNDPEEMLIQVFKKGSSAVVIFSQNSDPNDDSLVVIDLIEIAKIPAGWEISANECQVGDTEGEVIVALVLRGNGAYASKIGKAWRCNRDKIRFEGISLKGLKCENHGEE